MDRDTRHAIDSLRAAVNSLSARLADLGAQVAEIDHDLDALFEHVADDEADDGDREHRVLIGWKYDASSHKVRLLWGSAAIPVEPDDQWSDAPGGQAVEESY